MDFSFSAEQTLLRETIANLLAREGSSVESVDSMLGFRPTVWKQLAELGILDLGCDPDASAVDVLAVMTEFGRHLAPEPLAAAALVPAGVVRHLAANTHSGLLDQVVAGYTRIALAHQEPGHRPPAGTITSTAQRHGEGWLLTGVKYPVLSGNCTDWFVVSAISQPDGEVGLFLVEADQTVSCHPFRTFDGRRAAQVDFDDSPARRLDDGSNGRLALDCAVSLLHVSLCAEAVGLMEQALTLTVDYLRTRTQFGVPLQKFQALTQRAADMYVSLELARSMVYYLAMAFDAGHATVDVVSRVKFQVGRAARHIAQEAIQLHGGIGLTWEHPLSHYVARLTAIEHTLGTSDDHMRWLTGRVAAHDALSFIAAVP